MHVSGVFQNHFGIHCVMKRQVIESKENFDNCQHATTENSKGDAPPNSLIDLIASPKVKTSEG